MNNLAKIIGLGGRRLNKALAMHYLFADKGIPKGYIPLAYIESTGTQWINTGVILTEYTYDGNLMFTEVPAAGIATVFGAQLSAAPWNEKSVTAQNGKWRLYAYRGADSSIVSVGGTAVANTDYHISGQHKSGDIRLTVNRGLDDELNVINTASYNVNDNPIGIFAMYNSGRGAMYAKMRLYNLSFSTFDGELVRDYRPCISPDGEVGLYDLVDRKFYGNADTGEFIAGYGIDSYVHDAANLFLDGIWNSAEGVHSDALTGWIDLSGNCKPTPLGTGNTVGTNCIASDGTLNGRMTVPDVNPINLTTFTLEVIYKNGSGSNANQVILGRYNKTSYYVNTANNNLTTWIGGTAKTVAGSLSNANVHTLQLTCVGTSATAWVDGVKTAENYVVNATSTNDPLCLFGNARTDTCFNGSIMAVRIHNRILTDAEIMQNYEIDNQRFGLTETASVMSMADETDTEVTEDDTI